MHQYSSNFTRILNSDFYLAVQNYLDKHPEGVKEYDLLRFLEENNYFEGLPDYESMSLALFQKHFLLFHVLHSMNKQLVKDGQGSLHISPLLLKKLDYVEAESQLGEVDALSGYYLDLTNIESANEDNVNEMLNKFWEKYMRNDRRGDALKVLGLSDPVTDKEITQRYRRLASIHHPDKGGDTEIIQEINEAYALLIKV